MLLFIAMTSEILLLYLRSYFADLGFAWTEILLDLYCTKNAVHSLYNAAQCTVRLSLYNHIFDASGGTSYLTEKIKSTHVNLALLHQSLLEQDSTELS